jgi:anthranilate/para-aminobenzoate synthase component II
MHHLKSALGGNELTVVRYDQIASVEKQKYDKIIISGGDVFNVIRPSEKCLREIDFIMNSRKPLLGICLGFELICKAYGADIIRMGDVVQGLIPIRKTGNHNLLERIPETFKAYESHKHSVKRVGDDLLALAESEYGIEAIRHKSKHTYGVQFHPEVLLQSPATNVLENFLKYG